MSSPADRNVEKWLRVPGVRKSLPIPKDPSIEHSYRALKVSIPTLGYLEGKPLNPTPLNPHPKTIVGSLGYYKEYAPFGFTCGWGGCFACILLLAAPVESFTPNPKP